jgi:hypothetical protein
VKAANRAAGAMDAAQARAQARKSTIDAAEKALEEDLKRKRNKHRFGDEQGRVGRRRKGQGKQFLEDVDTFVDDEDDANGGNAKKKRHKSALSSSLKSGRDIKDVEEAEDDWEHSEDSDEEAERRKYEHESGFHVEAFNMDDERETGHFDAASGHYVEDKFKMSQRDAWLDEVNEKYAHGLQEKKKQREAEDEMEEEDTTSPAELLYILYSHLEEGETVPAAMRRMKANKTPPETFDKITTNCNKLLSSGYHGVFTDKREAMYTKLAPEFRAKIATAAEAQNEQSGSNAQANPSDDSRQWEYKLGADADESSIPQLAPSKMSIKDLRSFLDSQSVSYKGIVEKEDLEAKVAQTISRLQNQADQVYGPFSTLEMRSWAQQGYFSSARVTLIREVGSGADFVRSDRVDLEEMFS